MVLVPLAPWVTFTAAGVADSVKFAGVLMLSAIVILLVRVPDVPVTVMVEAPGAVELVVFKVRVLDAVALAALKDAVTPEGNPEAAKVTLPLKPFWALIAIALVAELPCAMLKVAGVAVRLNDGGPVIVSASLAVLVKLPDVPVIVIVAVPTAAELAAISVKVLVVVALTGLNDAVTPVGNPETLRFTALEKPCCAPTVMVLVPVAPGAIESVAAEEDKPKAGAFADPVKALIRG
jgi:hypothetical protein